MLNHLLTAKDQATYDSAGAKGLAAFESHFPHDDWACVAHREVYTEQNYKTLWDPPSREMRSGLHGELTAAGKNRSDYAAWLGATHWVQLTAYSTRLFSGGYKANQGWRIIALGIPPIGAVVFGLASHYQNAQAHKRLAKASNLFYTHIESLCAARGVPMVGRPISDDDWERCGLFPMPILDVAGVDVRGLDSDPRGLWLKDLRGSTLRKILASLIALELTEVSPDFGEKAGEVLDRLRKLGGMLLGPA